MTDTPKTNPEGSQPGRANLAGPRAPKANPTEPRAPKANPTEPRAPKANPTEPRAPKTDAPAIDAAVFDLGNVIIDVSFEWSFQAWARATGLPLEAIRERFAWDEWYERHERGELTSQAYGRHVSDLLGVDLLPETFLEGWNRLLGEVIPGIEPVLAWASEHVRLVALTNSNAANAAVWRPRLAGVLARFEGVFSSHEMGVRKPEAACFRRALDALGLPAARVAFFDDNAANVAAAKALGMRGFVVTTPDEVAAGLGSLGLRPPS